MDGKALEAMIKDRTVSDADVLAGSKKYAEELVKNTPKGAKITGEEWQKVFSDEKEFEDIRDMVKVHRPDIYNEFVTVTWVIFEAAQPEDHCEGCCGNGCTYCD